MRNAKGAQSRRPVRDEMLVENGSFPRSARPGRDGMWIPPRPVHQGIADRRFALSAMTGLCPTLSS
jgi:hypothetical protein